MQDNTDKTLHEQAIEVCRGVGGVECQEEAVICSSKWN